MRVDFRGGDVCVSQQNLDLPEVHSTFQKMRGKGMAERVRRDFGFDPGFESRFFDHLENPDPG